MGRSRRATQRRNNGPRIKLNPDYTAAKALPPGLAQANTSTKPQVRDFNQLLNYLAPGTPWGVAAPMPRDSADSVPFGPINPLRPAPISPNRRDTDRPEPRIFEYPVGWNIPGNSNRLIPWAVLYNAARQVDIMRRCIEVRKRHVRSLKWRWTVSEDAIAEAYQADPRFGRDDIEARLRQKWQPEIARLTAFWEKPWRTKNLTFGRWINGVQDQHLTLDAVAIYPRMTYGGDVFALEILDGSTIKPLIDWRGDRPAPPYPAYQQEIYGFPRGEYTATTEIDEDGNEVLSGGLAADQLYYWQENYQANSLFGFSAVEQALMSARLYVKRQGWMLSEYDDGSTPLTWLVPDSADAVELDPRQRTEWERALNDDLAGQTAARHRVKLSYPGFKPEMMPSVDERYKPDYDLYLIKLLAAHFGVPIAELGFTESKGLGSSGYHEGQEDVMDRVGRRPDVACLEEMVVDISRRWLRAPRELDFKLLGLESEDEAAQDQVADNRVKGARMTLNEDRKRTGQPLYPFPEADMPMVITQRGVVFLEGSSQLAAPGELIEPVQAPQATTPPEGAAADPYDHSAAHNPADNAPVNPRAKTAKPAGGNAAPKDKTPDTRKAATLTKQQAGYRDGVDELHRCRNCSMYRVSGDDDSGTCTLVKGTIAGDATCDHWEAAPAAKAADPTQAVAESDATRDRVRAQLAEDYPAKSMTWIDTAVWSGPESVPTSDIDYSNEEKWAASHESGKVDKFTEKIKAGKLKPIILVNTPDARRYIIIDGHHRALAYRKLGIPAMAYIARVHSTSGPWDQMHSSQRTGPSGTAPETEKSIPVKVELSDAAKAELAAYRNWVKKGRRRGHFEFTHPEAEAIAKAGDTHPKASARSWPGWERDRDTAAHYATRLRQALPKAVNTRQLADTWAKARNLTAKTATDDPTDARGWLHNTTTLASLEAALTAVLADAYTEGYALGDRSAVAMVTGAAVDWGAWTPGDADAATLVLGDDGLGAGLQQLLDAAGITIKSLGQGRFDELAQALALALENGDSPDTLARDLADILDNPAWAGMVAVTELNRAISASTLLIYERMGVEAKLWLTALDDRVCPVCDGNAQDGPVPLAGSFSSGADAPPGHPNCRCALDATTLTGQQAEFALADAGMSAGDANG